MLSSCPVHLGSCRLSWLSMVDTGSTTWNIVQCLLNVLANVFLNNLFITALEVRIFKQGVCPIIGMHNGGSPMWQGEGKKCTTTIFCYQL